MNIKSIEHLVASALELGARHVAGFSEAERVLATKVGGIRPDVSHLRELIRAGEDPLGEAFARLRSAEERRPRGQTYTPPAIISAMIDWARSHATPARVIDPGVGSARFLVEAGRTFPTSRLLGVDVDPVATLMARANLNTVGMGSRSRIELQDYRTLCVPKVDGKTLFVGNPPYVRHHGIPKPWKSWLSTTATTYDLKASQLAGLHVHFFLATLLHARHGDYGAFVTSAEWLDVNYGALVRNLLTGQLGGKSIHIMDPKVAPFSDAATTAAVTCFDLGTPSDSIRIRNVASLEALGSLEGGREIKKNQLEKSPRWTPLLKGTGPLPEGYMELGELARVHRGAVTGANAIWVTNRHATRLPESVLHPAVTKARELFAAGASLADTAGLKVVIDLPIDLDELDEADRRSVLKFLKRPEVRETKYGYIASARKAWWSVGLRAPAPILATYMARRPPTFVNNVAEARHINIAHGIYPRDELSKAALSKLAEYLRTSVSLGQGRTYAGGLTKFEPREMERLPVPTMELLNDDSFAPGVDELGTCQ